MSAAKESEVLSILQPDLLPVEELIERIQSWQDLNCKAELKFQRFGIKVLDEYQTWVTKANTCMEDSGRTFRRCCRIENLGLMSKEGLVGLFRRVILPLPQRFYRTNRRGKMLTSRRAKAGLEGRRREEGCLSGGGLTSRNSASDNRLRTSDGSDSNRIRLKNEKNVSSSKDLDKIVINDRRKLGGNEKKEDERQYTRNCDSLPSRKITLKRSPVEEKPSSQASSPSESKKQRTAIKWP